jgi:L-lactate dehydrogenase
MKVSIIGGGGRVGSNAAFAMQCAGIVSEIHLLDANEQMAQGEALDLLHGASVVSRMKAGWISSIATLSYSARFWIR